MAVTAAMVKELREMTGAGMMDCKKALAATDGDMDKAVEFLREKDLQAQLRRLDVSQLRVSLILHVQLTKKGCCSRGKR